MATIKPLLVNFMNSLCGISKLIKRQNKSMKHPDLLILIIIFVKLVIGTLLINLLPEISGFEGRGNSTTVMNKPNCEIKIIAHASENFID